MRLQSLALLAGASIVAADSTTTLFLPGFDAQSLDAKVLGSVCQSSIAACYTGNNTIANEQDPGSPNDHLSSQLSAG